MARGHLFKTIKSAKIALIGADTPACSIDFSQYRDRHCDVWQDFCVNSAASVPGSDV